MTPDIRQHLLAADREHPSWRIENTAESCFKLLASTLAKAGPDWAFVGKTDQMDGGKFYPPSFAPIPMNLTRPDGQRELVTITAVSMDSAWYVPSHQQVKVIANSTANDDPRPEIHGPANLSPYEIDPQYYRWHNPPIAQVLVVSGAGTPPPMPLPLPATGVLAKPKAFEALKALDAFYRAPEGLQRPDGVGGDMEAIAQWFYQLVIEGKTIEDVKNQIRQSDEWKGKHP